MLEIKCTRNKINPIPFTMLVTFAFQKSEAKSKINSYIPYLHPFQVLNLTKLKTHPKFVE